MTRHDTHDYSARLDWEGNLGRGTAAYDAYSRRYRIRFEGKADLVGSADPAFRGDPGLHNPEDLLLASLSSCHMLSYLALCARRRIEVSSYADEATGRMVETPQGGGRFESVTLRPRVVIADPAREAEALELHELAHSLCFIASSCNFPVTHQAEVRSAG